MKRQRIVDQQQASEKERLYPGSEPQRVAQPQPLSSRRRHKAALPGSQNADLRGSKRPKRPRGMST